MKHPRTLPKEINYDLLWHTGWFSRPIREIEKSMAEYPTLDDITNVEKARQWVPQGLLSFIQYLIPSQLKKQSIGQCITQASRPKSIMCPLPFGLGIELENSFGSKWLINHLSRFGFSISSDEVLRYKESAIEFSDHVQQQNKDDQFVQWVADNIDHNIVTLTG